MHGWMPTYTRAALERRRRGGKGDPAEGIGTTEYMRSVGGYGVTLECGQHSDPSAVDVAYNAIVNALGHLQLTDARPSPAKSKRPSRSSMPCCAIPPAIAWRGISSRAMP